MQLSKAFSLVHQTVAAVRCDRKNHAPSNITVRSSRDCKEELFSTISSSSMFHAQKRGHSESLSVYFLWPDRKHIDYFVSS